MIRKRKVFIVMLLIVFLNLTAFAGVKEDIYSKLKCCNCGKSFAPCVCAHAKEIKAYIDALLEVGLEKEEIFIKIAKKYSLDNITDKALRKEIEEKLISKAGKNRPQISIDPLSYNLGRVSKSKGKLKLNIKVQNTGKDVLKITDLKTTCACTTVQLKINKYTSPSFSTEGAESGWEASIGPEEKGELLIVTDLTHEHVHLGPMVRTVEIRSNDPVRSLIKIEFEAEIVK